MGVIGFNVANEPGPRFDSYYTVKEVARLNRVSVSTLYRWMDDGIFPRPVVIGKRRVVFVRDEVDAYLASRPRTAPGFRPSRAKITR